MGPFFGTDGRGPGSVAPRHFLWCPVLLRWCRVHRWCKATAGAVGCDVTAG